MLGSDCLAQKRSFAQSRSMFAKTILKSELIFNMNMPPEVLCSASGVPYAVKVGYLKDFEYSFMGTASQVDLFNEQWLE